ncbi:hypothetical protein [Armatimonas sp.]|uniref:hypothetical protein n=1 Tax=Armatimonas sp. TaxID=1872638 RepID=UPI00374D8759
MFWLTPMDTGFNGPYHLAKQLLKGEVAFSERTPYWEMYEREGKFYLCYAPLASAVLAPFVFLSGGHLTQPVLNTVFLLFSGIALWCFLQRLRPCRSRATLATAAYLLATPLFYSATQGSVWFLLHSEGLLFSMAAMAFLVHRRWFAFGWCFACACGCRNALLFTLPFTLMALWPRGFPKGRLRRFAFRGALALLGALAPLTLGLVLQWSMTGSLFITGYSLAYAEWKQLPVYQTVFFQDNLSFYFWRFPELRPAAPWLHFGPGGQSAWVISPFLLLALAAPLKAPRTRMLVVAALCGFVPYLFFRWNGFAQYGSRYTTDLFPFLVPLSLLGAARHKILGHLWLGLVTVAFLITALAFWEIKRGTLGKF